MEVDEVHAMLAAAIEAAHQAGEIQRAERGRQLAEFEKEEGASFATEVDHRCEAAIIARLRLQFPHHGFLAEESGTSGPPHAEFVWAIDPLDGTIQYVSGHPYFAVSIGLLRRAEPIVGVIHLTATGRTFWAQRGGGVFVDGEAIRVSREPGLSRAVLGFDVPDRGRRAGEIRQTLLPLADAIRFPYLFGGAAANLTLVAEGRLDGYLHAASPWDFAAGCLLVEEAGGLVTDHEGQPLDWRQDALAVVATNGLLHDQVLGRLAQSCE